MNSTPVVDTNVISELCRRRPDPGVLAWMATQRRLTLSVVTVFEAASGFAHRAKPRAERIFWEIVHDRCDVVPITSDIAAAAGTLHGEFRAGGTSPSMADLLIAVTARVRGLPVVTRNASDFANLGVTVVNPFTG